MITDQAKRDVLEKILHSREFSNSDRSKQLLTFLVHAALKGNSPKEVTIAAEVFGKSDHFDPGIDAYVRSSVYKLRKKLDAYYEQEGRDEELRITIPKGKYHLDFDIRYPKPEAQPSAAGVATKPWRRYLPTLLLLIIILLQAIWLYRAYQTPFDHIHRQAVWKEIASSDRPKCLVIGDVFRFCEMDQETRQWRVQTDPTILSQNDYNLYKQTFPQRQNNTIDFKQGGALAPSTVPCLSMLLPFFHAMKKTPGLKMASKLHWEDLNYYDIVYTGGITDLFILNNLLELTHIRAVPIMALQLRNDDGKVIASYGTISPTEQKDSYHVSFAAVIKLPGPNHNTVLMIIGNADNSRHAGVAHLLDSAFLDRVSRHFNDTLGYMPSYFELLLKVNGFAQIGYSVDILFAGELKNPQQNWSTVLPDSLTMR
jgi:hypothetical protein